MTGKGQLIENGRPVTLLQPQSVSNSAKTSLYCSMRNWKRLQIVIMVGANAGTSTNHIAVTLSQATATAGVGAKALSFDWYYTGPISQSVDALTKTAVTSDTFNIVAGTANTLYVIEILDTQLDIANGYQWVNVALAASGESAAILIAILGNFYDGDYSGLNSTLPSIVLPSPV